MMLLTCALLCLVAFSECKKAVQTEVVTVKDIKEWKKELRTKKNVLSVFLQTSKKGSDVQDLVADVSVRMRGRATVIVIDCGSATKLCKKLKVSPKSHIIHHYNNGAFNKDYDRRMTPQSMMMFLEDPTGDLPWSEDETATDVAHLDYQGFKRLLRKERLPVLAMFYTPWCGHCKRMKPEFSRAAAAMKGKAVLMGMDCDGTKGISAKQEFNVTSFPTILYFEKGELKFPFTGDRTEKGITEWLADPKSEISEPVPTDSWAETDASGVEHLKEATMAAFVQDNPSVLVMFYAPWCGHCKSMKPELMAAAKVLADAGEAGKLAAVDVTVEKKLGEEHGIKSFPTVIYFKNGEKSFEHPSLRQKDGIVKFMKDPQEPPPPAPAAGKWSDEASDVVHLTGESFDSTVKRKKHALIMFYAPWCGHCKKAKPEFTSAAKHFADNSKVMLGAIDCTEDGNKGVCGTYGVKGYPTMLYFTYGKDVHKYQGGRTEKDFILNLSDEEPRASNTMMTMGEGKEASTEWGVGVVHHLTKADYNSMLDKGPAFVLYYKAGCTTCRTLQQHFTDTATKLNTAVTLAAVDCLLYPSLCKGQTLPALVYHKGGKDTVFPYSQTTRDMVNFVHAQKDEL